jgi:hypothetical protein
MLLVAGTSTAQDYGSRLGVQRGGKVTFEPRGSGVMFGALDPSVQKWYVPQELYNEYQWRQWEYSNYAREPYQRYVNTALEGEYYYDFYGNFITRGWLVYDWRQDQPQPLGSSVFKDDTFNQWFSNVAVSSDSRGQFSYAVTVGNEIRTTLTPMTFSKPRFNGVQMDFAADKYQATLIASRISDPAAGVTVQPDRTTNSTSLFGGRATVQVGDFITVGGTLVDARNANTALDVFSGDMVAGSLTSGQSTTPVTSIAIVLGDDSPEDGTGGAALFRHDIQITARDFDTDRETIFRLQDVVREGLEWPTVFGGFPNEGFTSADGSERIVLNYDFNSPAYVGPDPLTIVNVEFEYVLANDFRVDMWSNKQTGQRPTPTPPLTNQVIADQQPALITLRRAQGNVRDISNLQTVSFDYGLPTANLIGGFTVEGRDLYGFDLSAEWDRNVRYFQYPNPAVFSAGDNHEISSSSADAWFVNLSKRTYPWFGYLESYSIAEDYSTTARFVVDGQAGNTEYDSPRSSFYEFVDDNDDQDRTPDWSRRGQSAGDRIIFPGWDENNDFVSDFNQNDNNTIPNNIPDYEEPFLRFSVDRPEFLFGIDLNNNAWIDRFENDDLPDYLYRADRRGYNAFIGADLTPDARLTLGRLDERTFSDLGSNESTYGLFTYDRDHQRVGRVRVFNMLKRVEDTIADDRRAPSASLSAEPAPLVRDILPAQDTWVNSTFASIDFVGISDLILSAKLKYDLYKQVADEPRDIDDKLLNDSTSLFGMINKAAFETRRGPFLLHPGLKSEYFRRSAFLAEESDVEHWRGIAQLRVDLPVTPKTRIQTGLELMRFHDLETDEEDLLNRGVTQETGDFTSTQVALQLSITSGYLGYVLTTQVGLKVGRIRSERISELSGAELAQVTYEKRSKSRSEATSFITVFAGL